MSPRLRTHGGRFAKRLPRGIRRVGRAVRPSRLLPSAPLARSLYERHPGAITAPRTAPKLESVPLDRIVGTVSRPSQHDAAFRPIKARRTRDWQIRSTRIGRALEQLEPMPPVELIQVDDEYYVVDGHKRVAAAKAVDGAEIDAMVTRLWPRGGSR